MKTTSYGYRFRKAYVQLVAAGLYVMILQTLCAADYYVDASNGNDGWDGTSATHVEGSVGPKKTLAGVMAITGLGSGDTVYAAEGCYTNGVMEEGSVRYRVAVPSKVKLVASGLAERTFIVGEEAPLDATDRDVYGNGSGSMKCVRLSSSARLVGFTVTGGRTPIGGSAGAIVGNTDAYVVDCIISNNVAANRGGAIYYGPRPIRCLFANNRALGGVAHSMQDGMAYNCVCAENPAGYHFYQVTSYNCTFIGPSSRSGNTYNAIVLGGDGGSDRMYNCYYVNNLGSGTIADETCMKCTAGDLSLDEDHRLAWTSVAIDKGDPSRYSFPAAISSERDKDFHGAWRMVGTIDVGACEFDWRTRPAVSGLESSVETVGDCEKLRVWRNFASSELVKGFTYGDTTVMFEDVEGGVWERIVEGRATAYQLTPIYEKNQVDWYVNPNPSKGDDRNPGYHPDCPKRTLMGAMALAKYGDIVHAARGVYADGQAEGNTASRVNIPAGVGLVADEGATATVIEGYIPADNDGDGTEKIGGVGSVRCVSMGSGAYIKGFTLRNGATCPARNDAYGDNGGGLSGGTAIDCIITNCYGVRGGGSASSKLIRCYLADCGFVTGTNTLGQIGNNAGLGMYGGSAYDSYLGDQVLNVENIVNCTVDSVWVANGNFTHLYNSIVKNGGNELTSSTNTIWGYIRTGMDIGEGSSIGSVDIDPVTKRPLVGDVKAIDRGNVAYYTYPIGFEHEMGRDLFGGQRIYNKHIDIGCGEYDWRPKFSGELGKRFTVTYASQSVTTNAMGGLLVSDGAVAGTVTSVGPYVIAFTLTGGSLAVYVGGELAGESSGTGEQMIRLIIANVVDEIRFVYTSEAGSSAVLKKFSGAHGFSISFR